MKVISILYPTTLCILLLTTNTWAASRDTHEVYDGAADFEMILHPKNLDQSNIKKQYPELGGIHNASPEKLQRAIHTISPTLQRELINNDSNPSELGADLGDSSDAAAAGSCTPKHRALPKHRNPAVLALVNNLLEQEQAANSDLNASNTNLRDENQREKAANLTKKKGLLGGIPGGVGGGLLTGILSGMFIAWQMGLGCDSCDPCAPM